MTHEHPRWRESRHVGARLLTMFLAMQHIQCSMLNFLFFFSFFAFSHSHLVFALDFWRSVLYLELHWTLFFLRVKSSQRTSEWGSTWLSDRYMLLAMLVALSKVARVMEWSIGSPIVICSTP